jgi:hypothetical protein
MSTEQELVADGYERVHVELEWYSGPRKGVADIGGVPHYFYSWDFDERDAIDKYVVWPASPEALAMERESWVIFAKWNDLYQAGTVGTDTHPGRGGISARYDELKELLAPYREAPQDAKAMLGQMGYIDEGPRYSVKGVDYMMRWSPGQSS